MHKLLGSALLTAALVGCGEQSPEARYLKNHTMMETVHKQCQKLHRKDREKNPDCIAAKKAYEQVALEHVRESLKDPQSAQFSSVYAAWSTEVCGNVNARNSFGGYTGDQAFHYDAATNRTVILPRGNDYKYEHEKNAALRCLNWLIKNTGEGLE